MFEEEILQGDAEKRIVLQTRLGRSIRNVIEPPPTDLQRKKYEAIRRKYGGQWHPRKPACGGYNCYGMALASRRTSILEDEEVDHILLDDGYRRIAEGEALPGDLVLYKDRQRGPLHVALILRRDKRGEMPDALWALSKWNSTSGEDEHFVYFHCWTDAEYDITLEFWTDR